ncbi:hypothetical protein BOTBODRAFT_30834 [Botryobasidium botryosum FD-172 SS1]|uniref:MYND-type domain-containing protein n=1 Tax=Botryobasidium botryosum (strain FD-172 SS1) TaxID=930990 RepID=A0A067ML60_BOTB1|nr:hypothetical protein BOTBODRAFT_30834 [Botryobasidium botryosum FD-172 SS1]
MCSKCRVTPYCSVNCQRADWPIHKKICDILLMNHALDGTSVTIGQKASRRKKGEVKRSRRDMLKDLTVWAETHNVDTLALSSWAFLDLKDDIGRAQTHFLAITLYRTSSSTPRTMYSLAGAEVLPFSVLEEGYEDASLVDPYQDPLEGGRLSGMIEIFERNREERIKNGALGAVLVASIELKEGDTRPVRQAFTETNVRILQPLGLFKEYRESLLRIPPLTKEMCLLCLKNALDGGAWSLTFRPLRPM